MKRKTMGWLIVFLLFIVYMLNYMDRSALSITAPLIEKELGFNAAEMGMIFSAFFIGYALFNFIGGWASDKVGYLLIEPLLPDLRYNHAPSNPYPGDFEWI